MKNELYLVLVRENGRWNVAMSSSDYIHMLQYYAALRLEKILFRWRLVEGVKIIRMNAGKTQWTDELDNVELPFDALPYSYRLWAVPAILDAVVNYLKE